jgi:16S rRNA processing protein RimM
VSPASEWVRLGRVGRPHGLDGAFTVEEASESPERFAEGATIWAGRRPARVVELKRARGRPVIRLDRPVNRGTALEVPRDRLPPPDPGSYYVADLIGLDVVDESGERLGRVADVAPGVANDVLELDSGLALPLAESCVREIAVGAGTITVAAGFSDFSS